MSLPSVSSKLQDVIPLWGAVIASLTAGRLVEYGFVAANHSLSVSLWRHELLGMVHDIQAGLLLAVGLTVVYLCLSVVNRRVAFWGFTSGAAVVAVLHLVLVRYYATTLQPLGTDFWAYDLREVTNTVQASEAAGGVFWGAALGLGGLAVGLSVVLRRWRAPVPVVGLAGGLALASLFITPPALDANRPSAEYLAPNKTVYFITESTGLLFDAPSLSDGRDFPRAERTVVPSDSVYREYPWMYRAHYDDVLGPYFRDPGQPERPPNLVFIVFEGLGTSFVGEDAPYGGFTPFVDSLSHHSLYWPNTLSTTGRTFGLMPSLFGSLPYADRGFMAMGKDMPRHQSLIRLLNEEGYYTSYYSGFDTPFDNVDRFLRRQDIDRVVDRSGLNRLFGGDPGVEERYWGYPDKEMFSRASAIIDTVDRQPRLEIFHTLQTHDPFVVPDEDRYQKRFEQRLQTLDIGEAKAERYQTYQSELTTFLYTDDALRQFIDSYRARPEFDNTIFVITGDHRLIPIPQPSQIARYHVPLLIYSPLLKKSETFKSVSTLANVTPTLLGLLEQHYGRSFPERAHWLGGAIDTTRAFRNVQSMPLMRNKNQLIDYLHHEYYLAGDQLYRLSSDLTLSPTTNPEKRAELQQRMGRFKTINQYVTRQDRLFSQEVPLADLPPTTPFRAASTPSAAEATRLAIDSVLARVEAQDLNTTEQFQLARQMAFEGEYGAARSLAERLLERNPDYHDVRTLLGRTYSWTRDFNQARDIFREVIRRDSSYADAYNALADAELWADRPDAALSALNDGLRHHPRHPSFLVKKAEALLALGRRDDASRVVATLAQVAPEHEELGPLKEQIGS